jgi:hypothetical protein
MNTSTLALSGLLCIALCSGCQTTSTATGAHEVRPETAYQLADLQARYASGEMPYESAFTSGVGLDSEMASKTLLIALVEKVYGWEATIPMRRDNDLSKSPIRIADWELLETDLRRVSAHWTKGRSRMRVSTAGDGDYIISYAFRVSLNKTAGAPPAWADELYASEQIIHSLGGFEVTSIRKLGS